LSISLCPAVRDDEVALLTLLNVNGFFGPRESARPNVISIGSSVFAGLTVVTSTQTRHTDVTEDASEYAACWRCGLAKKTAVPSHVGVVRRHAVEIHYVTAMMR